MKKVVIKVEVTDVTPEEQRISKNFFTRFEFHDKIITEEHFLSEAEYYLIQSIAQRLVKDKDNLIRWEQTPGAVSASLELIPVKDYQPE